MSYLEKIADRFSRLDADQERHVGSLILAIMDSETSHEENRRFLVEQAFSCFGSDALTGAEAK
jgi:hypothetical protein